MVRRVLAFAAAAVLVLSFAACKEKTPAQQAGEQLKAAKKEASKAATQAEKAATETGQEVKKAAEDIQKK